MGASLPAAHAASPALFLPEINSTSARVLLFLVVPGHLIFFSIIYLVEGQSVPNDKTFVGLYLLAGLVQVTMAPGSHPGRGPILGEVPGHAGHSPHLPEVHPSPRA